MKSKGSIIIDAIIVDPPVISPGETARIIIHARSTHGGPLDFEVQVSEGVIEPTDEPNVFLWHVPERTVITGQTQRIRFRGQEVLPSPKVLRRRRREVRTH